MENNTQIGLNVLPNLCLSGEDPTEKKTLKHFSDLSGSVKQRDFVTSERIPASQGYYGKGEGVP
jgi:hypothetical protein